VSDFFIFCAVLTSLEPGFMLRIRRKHVCPCIHWGSYCTTAHNFEEVCVLQVKDEIQFTSVISKGLLGEQVQV
jgi:hypothetical protein